MRVMIGVAVLDFNKDGNLINADFRPALPISVDGPLYHNLEEKLDGCKSEEEVQLAANKVIEKWFKEVSKEELHQSIPVEVTSDIASEFLTAKSVKCSILKFYYNSVNPQLN